MIFSWRVDRGCGRCQMHSRMQAACTDRQRALRPHCLKSRSHLLVHWIICCSDASTIGGGEGARACGETARTGALGRPTQTHVNTTPIKPLRIVFEWIMFLSSARALLAARP